MKDFGSRSKEIRNEYTVCWNSVSGLPFKTWVLFSSLNQWHEQIRLSTSIYLPPFPPSRHIQPSPTPKDLPLWSNVGALLMSSPACLLNILLSLYFLLWLLQSILCLSPSLDHKFLITDILISLLFLAFSMVLACSRYSMFSYLFPQ